MDGRGGWREGKEEREKDGDRAPSLEMSPTLAPNRVHPAGAGALITLIPRLTPERPAGNPAPARSEPPARRGRCARPRLSAARPRARREGLSPSSRKGAAAEHGSADHPLRSQADQPEPPPTSHLPVYRTTDLPFRITSDELGQSQHASVRDDLPACRPGRRLQINLSQRDARHSARGPAGLPEIHATGAFVRRRCPTERNTSEALPSRVGVCAR